MKPKLSPARTGGGTNGRTASLADQHAYHGVPHRFRRSRKKQTSRANRAFRADGPGARLMASLGSSACFYSLTVADLDPAISDAPDGIYDPAIVNALFSAAARHFRGPFFMTLEVGRGDLDAPGRGRLHPHVIAHRDDGPQHIARDSERCKPVYDAVKLYGYLHKGEPYTLEALSDLTAARILYGKPPRVRRHFLDPARTAWAASHCSKNLTLEPRSPRAAAGQHNALAIDCTNTSPSTVAAIPQTAPQPSHDGLRARPAHLEGTARAAPHPRSQPATANSEAPNTPNPAQRPARRAYEAPGRPPRHRLDSSRSSVPTSTHGYLRTAHRRARHLTMTTDRTALRALFTASSTAPPHALLRSSGPTPGPSP